MLRIPQAEKALACSKCKSKLTSEIDRFVCQSCGSEFKVKEGKVYFEFYKDESSDSQLDAMFYRIKRYFKENYPNIFILIYSFVMVRVGPKLPTLIDALPVDALIVNVGAGAKMVDRRTLNVDLVPESGVDVVANAYSLPFMDESVDMVISESLLEHLETPERAIDQMRRILKPGGMLFIVTPFIHNVHSSPNDYYRWTIPGMKMLLTGFTLDRAGAHVGPTGALTVVLREWCAMFLSFNSNALYQLWVMFFMILFAPINLLDFLIARYSFATQLASEYYFIARKEDNK